MPNVDVVPPSVDLALAQVSIYSIYELDVPLRVRQEDPRPVEALFHGRGWLQSLLSSARASEFAALPSRPVVGPLVTTLGLLCDIAGAWLVAWEVVRQYRGKRFQAGGKPDDLFFGPHPVRETEAFQKWELLKLTRMKWGLVFLTVGFILQIAATWIPRA